MDDEIWATEDEYRNWNNTDNTTTTTNNPNKKTRTSQPGDSKAIGRMFYKTKLCCKFRAGICPYITNCNFAHGIEELRKPPPNWQDIVGAAEKMQEEKNQLTMMIPTVVTIDSRAESQRSFKGRHCKKFYTEEGCPYGESCTFLHDEQSRDRESVAINISVSVGTNVANAGNGGAVNLNVKPSNWKTRICNKWETTGTCPFGNKCHFAHGYAELHNFTGGSTEGDGRDYGVPSETKPSSGNVGTKPDANTCVPRVEYHHVVGGGIPSQRVASVNQVVGQRPIHKWKGPDKISRIYGDWIDDIE